MSFLQLKIENRLVSGGVYSLSDCVSTLSMGRTPAEPKVLLGITIERIQVALSSFVCIKEQRIQQSKWSYFPIFDAALFDMTFAIIQCPLESLL